MVRLLVLLAVSALPLFAGPREIDKTARLEGRAVILRPAAALTEADESELARKGVFVKHALPGGRYLVRLRTDADTRDERIVAIEEITADRKLHPSAVRAAVGRTMAGVNVVFHRDVPFDEAREAILAAGGAMDVFTVRYLPSHRIEAKVPSAALLALAGDERVFAVAAKRNLKIGVDNAVTAQTSHVTELYSAPYGLSGDGVAVSLFELAAAQSTHPEFGGRMVTVNASGGSSADRRHATHVAGTIGAAGLAPAAKGMAPKANIHQFCVRVFGLNSCSGDWLTVKDQQLHTRGIIADNNSWGYIWGWEEGSPPIWNLGDASWGAYDLELAAPIDEISIDRGILFIHSAGNDGSLPIGLASEWRTHIHWDPETEENVPGLFCVSKNGTGADCPATTCTAGCEASLHHPQTPFDTLGTTASAKNVISVGAVHTDLSIIGFSSRGPAKDGRIKPEVVARGANVFSTVPESSYTNLNGTSMAAPAVTGMAALLTEQWRRTFGGANPRPEELKALLIAGTEDLGNPGPDYTFGFGLVNAKKSVDLIRSNEGGLHIRNFSFTQGGNEQRDVALVVEQPQTLRVVLNWPDPAIPFFGGDVYVAEKSLVNNLDLRVVDPAGNVWLPYVLDRNNPQAHATRGVNDVDNIEMVEIPNAAPGIYRVVATGTNVADGPQPAVLVTTVRTARPCVDVQEPAGINNNGVERATSIAGGGKVFAGLCDAADVDFYSFTATKTGAVSVTITTGDTAVRATLTGNGIARSQDIPAFTTAVLNADVNTAPNAVTLKIEASGAFGVEPQYNFTAEFPELRKPKRRAAR
ncbi:MAG TPA: S8 family serine peptidase [Thermoanaerobaculia bacterium]